MKRYFISVYPSRQKEERTALAVSKKLIRAAWMLTRFKLSLFHVVSFFSTQHLTYLELSSLHHDIKFFYIRWVTSCTSRAAATALKKESEHVHIIKKEERKSSWIFYFSLIKSSVICWCWFFFLLPCLMLDVNFLISFHNHTLKSIVNLRYMSKKTFTLIYLQ